MYFLDLIGLRNVFKFILKELEDLFRYKFFMQRIGCTFCHISHSLAHLLRKLQTVMLLQNVTYATFSGLAVDSDHVCIVRTSDIGWINGKIRNRPCVAVIFFPVLHTLCDRILMRTGKCSEYKSTAVGASLIYLHAGILLIQFCNLSHIRKIKFRIYTLGIHIHRQCDNIHVSCPLTVSKESSLNSVSACKDTHLRIGNTAASVIMGMKRNHYILSVFQMFIYVFYLTCINMGHRHLYGARKVDNGFPVCRRFPHI